MGISEFHDRASTDKTSAVVKLGVGTAILLVLYEQSIEVI